MELLIHDSAEEAADAAALRIAALISEAGERFSLGLAGGSAAEATYRALRGRAAGWERVDGWLSDERWVPPDDERSNGRMVSATLLDHVGGSLFRPPWSANLEPEDSAAHYEARLRVLHGDRPPDLVVLGMGADGHTASLFPGTPALDERSRWYVPGLDPGTGEERLTATYPLLWSASLLLVVAFGADKAGALEDSFSGRSPAGRIGDGDAAVEWFVDRDAAAFAS